MEIFGRETREYMFEEVRSVLEERPNVFFTSFTNLKVADLQGLRASLNKASSIYMVVKNTISRRVLEELKKGDTVGMVDGMCGMVFLGNDPIAASKALINFKKDHQSLDIKGGLLDGCIISSEKIKELSATPPKEVLLAMLVRGMYSPVTGFVNSLSGIVRKFVYAINAIKEKRG